MNSDNIGGQPRPEALDADAVCAQCNTVNTEGTLLCKNCGNNLRDQRMVRLSADQEMDLVHAGRRRRSWISGIFFVLAILLIVTTLINQEAIVAWLIEPGGSSNSSAQSLWSGERDAVLGPMASELSARAITGESALAALENGTSPTGLEGDYALFEDEEFVGSARALFQGEEIYFVGVLEDGEEIRGVAVPQGNYYAALPENAAIRIRGRLSEIRGVAMPQGDGVVDCIGEFSNSQRSFSAYRLPD